MKMKFDEFINETDEIGQKPVTVDDIDNPKAYQQMLNWLESHGIFIKDIKPKHIKQIFRMNSDSEYDIAFGKLQKLLKNNNKNE